MISRDPEKMVYDVLRAAGTVGEDIGLTAYELEQRCEQRYGKRGYQYWTKQVSALRDLGYARIEGTRKVKGAYRPVWIATDPTQD